MTTKKWYYKITIRVYDEKTGMLINYFCENDLRDEIACFIDTDIKNLMNKQERKEELQND